MRDEKLEQEIVRLLIERGKYLATAESCTGGYLAHRITLVPGSSHVFQSGWITYSDEAKIQMLGVSSDLIAKHGAVSDPVVKSMAEKALQKSNANYAIAITGIAGPDGGSEEYPVGTVFIALASKSGIRSSRFQFQLDRETFKFVATQTALNILREEILK